MDVPILTGSARERFVRRLRRDEATGCLLWQGSRTPRGYGTLSVGGQPKNGGRTLYAHRLAFVLGGGALTQSEPFVLHHCDNPSCCEITHLYAGNQAQNMDDWRRRGSRRR